MKEHILKTGFAAAVLTLAVTGLAACQSGQAQQEPEAEESQAYAVELALTVPETEMMSENTEANNAESIPATEDSAVVSDASLTEVSPEISEQIAVYVSNRGVWMQDDEYEKWSYALHDLDRDGKLELITTSCQGTGLFSNSYFYRLEEAADTVVEIPQETDVEIDLGLGQPEIYRDDKSGKLYFYGTDSMKDGAAHGGAMNGYFCYENGQITDVTNIGGYDCLYEDEESEPVETWFDGEGITSSYEEWQNARDAFLEDKILTGDMFFWDGYYTNRDYEFRMSTLSNEEMQAYLEDLYVQYRQYIANRAYDMVAKRLSAYSAGAGSHKEIWQQFADAVAQGTPAQIVVARPTTEGDEILTYLDYNGHNIYGLTDSSRDAFAGGGCPQEGFFFYYLKAFEETDEEGNTHQLWALVNREDVTLEELKEGESQESYWDSLDYQIVFDEAMREGKAK